MADEVVVLREFANEIEADLAAATLEANGVPAEVLRNSARYPPNYGSVRILVRAEDVELARELLDTPVDPTS